MKVVLQDLRSGQTMVAETSRPSCGRAQVLVRTSQTLISAGTERMIVEFGKAGWIAKARMQPERLRDVMQKARTDGVLATVDAVRAKLDRPLALGYCNVGRAEEVGADVAHIRAGDRVASNGGHAGHVAVAGNLCARVPDEVSDEEAVFTVAAAIALQGIRLAAPTLGECVAVSGLGLIGLITVQLLRAHGCRVLGLDFDPDRLELARRFGAEVVNLAASDPVGAAMRFSRGRGMDAVIVAASTPSSAPVDQAASMSRKRGRIVMVGVTGMELSRAAFYEKELSFQVSCSYGPGRYDPSYEEKGQDYPAGFVRWTAQRNFEAVLDMMADGRLDMRPLISHRFAVEDAPAAYAAITGEERSLGVLLSFPKDDAAPMPVVIPLPSGKPGTGKADPKLGFIGAGGHALSVLIPAFARNGAAMAVIASKGGVSAWHAGRKFGFSRTAEDADSVLDDPAVDAVVVTTRHASHADLVAQALRAGKHVFVEKPLATTLSGLETVETAWHETRLREHPPLLHVGYNRRHAPHTVALKTLIEARSAPAAFLMTVNAGALPASHWTRSEEEGGRIIGEACHFVDLLRYLAAAPITGSIATGNDEGAALHLSFADGSQGTIHYLANGSKRFPKERLEVFCAGAVARLDNFRRLEGFGWPGLKPMRKLRQDKGHLACAGAFLEAIRGGEPSISFEELREVARITLDLAEQLRR